MSYKKNTGTLAKAITLICAAYLPQAYADQTVDFGTINAPALEVLSNTEIPTGAFTDTYNFNITAGANVGSAAVSFTWTADTTDQNELGASLTGISLDTGAGSVITAGNVTTAYGGYDASSGLYGYTYTGTIASTALAANAAYSIVITGNGGDYNGPFTYQGQTYEAPGFYTGALSLATPTNGSPTPEPEQWAMLLLGLPLIGWVSRNKQTPLRHATLA